MRKPLIISLVIILGLAAALIGFREKAFSPKNETTNQVKTTQNQQPQFDKTKYSLTDPSSIWVIASKTRILNPPQFAPSDLVTPNIPLRSGPNTEEMKLRKEPAAALERMVAAAKKQGAGLKLASGYRSYTTQVAVYNNEVKQYGQAQADRESARPGHSEHQTGLALDLQDSNGQCVVADCFATLAEGKWVAEHAWEYGFVIRYPSGKEAVTGYRYEPWHIRYVGTDLAQEMHKTNSQTLEEFFGIVEKQPY